MANEVYANGMEVSCKAANGKAICAFPDVCFTPPQTPATPPGVPIPYPNTGMASDTTSGSKTVKITGKEAMLKNKSYFSTSTGDEAGCAPKKGVLTSKNKGKVYFNAWSMDVKIEGENVVRHFDLTTHNHASFPGNSPPWSYIDAITAPNDACKQQQEDFKKCQEDAIRKNVPKSRRRDAALPDKTKKLAETDDSAVDWGKVTAEKDYYEKKGAMDDFCKECGEKTRCVLMTFDQGCCPTESGEKRTGHHLIPVKDHHKDGVEGADRADKSALRAGSENYDEGLAPCICATGHDHGAPEADGRLKEHGRIGRATAVLRNDKTGDTYKYSDVAEETAQIAAHHTKCDKDCIKAQMDAYHNTNSTGDLKKSQQAEKGGDVYLKEAIPPAQVSTGIGS